MNEMTLCKNICAQRKAAGLTQDALAAKLGVTYQAVSKWENGLSCPDVQLLPQIAEIFGISIDALFGRAMPDTETHQPAGTPDALVPVSAAEPELPWEDDDTLYVVLYHGHELISTNPFPYDSIREVPFIFEGHALNINSALSVRIEGDVEGSVFAGGDVECSDVGGDAQCGGDLNCGDISGHAYAKGDISCGDVEGNVYCTGDVDSGSVVGSVTAGGDVDCSGVGGDVNAHGDVDCGGVAGNVYAGGDVDCGSVMGNVRSEVRMDAEWQQKMNDLNRASADFAKQKVEEATLRMNEAGARAREKAGGRSKVWHYEFDNGSKVDIELEDIEEKVDGIVNKVEIMLDGLFDGLRGKKKKNDNADK